MKTHTSSLLVPFVCLAGSTLAVGQSDFPVKPITLVIAAGPGGSSDKFSRVMALHMEKQLGQPVVLEYKPGGGNNIGIEHVVRSKPDGYTLLMAGNPLAVNPSLYKKLTYKLDDLAPISMVSVSPYLLVLSSSTPVKTLPELVAYAKQNPAKLSYGSPGIGSGAHMGGALLNMRADIKITHIPYKNSSQVLTDIMGNNLQMTFTSLVVGTQLVEAGRIRALAVTSSSRSTSLPNIPTVAEQGYPGYELTGWYGVMAPRATPPDVIAKLNEAIVSTLKDPEVVKALNVDGIELVPGTPQDFAKFLQRTAAEAAIVVKATGATAE